jgi:demethylmenaquinone methyltransferase/2-methoxy-6-polyprenyl-1,4-benzoquinol methylase
MAGFQHDSVVPYSNADAGKKEQVAEMFDDIAHRYDFMNRFLSAGIDKGWRRKALKDLSALKPRSLLDVATGTAEVALMAADILKPDRIVGIDISEGMLELGRKKVRDAGLDTMIELRTGDSESIRFPDESFDAATVAFGVRNFADLVKGLTEIRRVLRPGGRLIVLEFSKPSAFGLRHFYNFYTGTLAPHLGGLFSRNRKAYRYLHDSVQAFPEGRDFMQVLSDCGYRDLTCKRLSFGICSVYAGSR